MAVKGRQPAVNLHEYGNEISAASIKTRLSRAAGVGQKKGQIILPVVCITLFRYSFLVT